MPPTDHRPWDRASDLDRVRATYARYDAAGRERLWDRGNRGYARLLRALREALIGEIVRSLPPGGGTLVDLGCGAGDLIEDAERAGVRAKWIGVDLRPEIIERAQRSYPNGTFLVASADAVPEPDAVADVVVAQLLFSSLPTDHMEEAVAAEVHRLLKPGGSLVWCDLRLQNPFNSSVHGISADRLRALFPGWITDLRAIGVLPPLARRLGPATPLLYPVLGAMPALRGHLVGRLHPHRS